MGAFRNAIGIMFNRPIIIFYFGIITLILSVVNHLYNPVLPILFGFTGMGGSIFESIMALIQLLINSLISINAFSLVAIVVLTLVVASVLVGLLFSGLFNIINTTIEGSPREKGEFFAGIKKHFLRTFTLTFRVLLFGIIFALFNMIVLVPAVVITRASISGNLGILAVVIFLDIITIAVIILGFLFFRAYLFFWYPSALSFDRNAFIEGKHLVDRNFWRIAGKFVRFDLMFLVFQALFIYLNYFNTTLGNRGGLFSIVMFIISWLFNMFFFASFLIYIFSAFKDFAGDKIKNRSN